MRVLNVIPRGTDIIFNIDFPISGTSRTAMDIITLYLEKDHYYQDNMMVLRLSKDDRTAQSYVFSLSKIYYIVKGKTYSASPRNAKQIIRPHGDVILAKVPIGLSIPTVGGLTVEGINVGKLDYIIQPL